MEARIVPEFLLRKDENSLGDAGVRGGRKAKADSSACGPRNDNGRLASAERQDPGQEPRAPPKCGGRPGLQATLPPKKRPFARATPSGSRSLFPQRREQTQRPQVSRRPPFFRALTRWASGDLSYKSEITSLRLVISRPNRRLADQELGVRAGARGELLGAAVIDFGHVEVAFLIDAEAVHAPEAAGEIAPGAPGIQEVPLQVVLQHLGGAAVEGPERAIRADVDQVNIGRIARRCSTRRDTCRFRRIPECGGCRGR